MQIWKLQYLKPLLLALMMEPTMMAAFAETPKEAVIKKVIEPWLGDGVKVDTVTKTPYLGMFEVRVGKDFLY